jgi:hypothetical protein
VPYEGYAYLTGDNYKYVDNRRQGDTFNKITVDMLKTILQSAGTDDVFNRIMSDVDFDIYDGDDNDDLYTNDNLHQEDTHDKSMEPNINLDTMDIPDEAFTNILYTMVIGITSDKYNKFDDNLVTQEEVSQASN